MTDTVAAISKSCVYFIAMLLVGANGSFSSTTENPKDTLGETAMKSSSPTASAWARQTSSASYWSNPHKTLSTDRSSVSNGPPFTFGNGTGLRLPPQGPLASKHILLSIIQTSVTEVQESTPLAVPTTSVAAIANEGLMKPNVRGSTAITTSSPTDVRRNLPSLRDHAIPNSPAEPTVTNPVPVNYLIY